MLGEGKARGDIWEVWEVCRCQLLTFGHIVFPYQMFSEDSLAGAKQLYYL